MVNTDQNILPTKKRKNALKNNYTFSPERLLDMRFTSEVSHEIDITSSTEDNTLLINKVEEYFDSEDTLFDTECTDEISHNVDMSLNQEISHTNKSHTAKNYVNPAKKLDMGCANEIAHKTNAADTGQNLLPIKETNTIENNAHPVYKLLVKGGRNERCHKIHTKRNIIQVNKMNTFQNYTCSVDRLLDIGDTIEIPGAEHIIIPIKIMNKVKYYTPVMLKVCKQDISHKIDMASIDLHSLPASNLNETHKHFAYVEEKLHSNCTVSDMNTFDYGNDLFQTSSPRKSHTKLITDYKLKMPCFSCTDTKLDPNNDKGLRVYNADKNIVVLHYSGIEESRFVKTINKHMQTLLIKDPALELQENNELLSITLAINLENLENYFGLHHKLDNLNINRHGYLRKFENNISTLLVNTTPTLFSIYIKRQLILIHITICKFNSLCEILFNSLAIMSGIKTATSVSDSPAHLFQNWHFYNIAQGYILKHLLADCNVITLTAIRKLYFVIILSPFPNLDLQIKYQCLTSSEMFNAPIKNSLTDYFCKSFSWSQDYRAQWTSSALVEPGDTVSDRQPPKSNMRFAKSDTLANRSMPHNLIEETVEDLNSIYRQSYTDFESTSTSCSGSELLIDRKSTATVCDLLDNETSTETVVFNLKNSFDVDNNEAADSNHCINLNFFCRKMWISFPKIFRKKRETMFYNLSCCSITNIRIISEVGAIKDQYINLMKSEDFRKIFLKTLGKLLATTVITSLI